MLKGSRVSLDVQSWHLEAWTGLTVSSSQAQFLLIPEWRMWHHLLELELLKEAH